MQIHKYAHFDHFSWLYNPFWWTILTHPRVGFLGLYGVVFQMLYFEISLVTAYILVSRCQRHVIDWNQLPTKTQLSGMKQLCSAVNQCYVRWLFLLDRGEARWWKASCKVGKKNNYWLIEHMSSSFMCFTNSQQSSTNKPGVREGRCGGDGSERQVW